MRLNHSALFASILLSFFFIACQGQTSLGSDYLVLQHTIPLPDVKGRIDHMDVNKEQGIIYIAALANNTLEVVDLAKGKVIHRIEGLDEPQGVGYIPDQHEIFVANGGSGECSFYNAGNYQKTASLKLSSDADDVRYDPVAKKIYVGYGSGGIAIIDALTHLLVEDIKLKAHPEGFQIDKALNRLYVNVPDAHMIAVIDLGKNKVVEEWRTEGSANFPMAIDTVSHTLFIGYRKPAQITVLDGQSGKVINNMETVDDMDDLYFDVLSGQVFVSGGGGAIEIFRKGGNKYQKLVHLPVRTGARTSLFIPSIRLFLLAEKAKGSKYADLLVYKLAGK